jgi:hypothetical protein
MPSYLLEEALLKPRYLALRGLKFACTYPQNGLRRPGPQGRLRDALRISSELSLLFLLPWQGGLHEDPSRSYILRCQNSHAPGLGILLSLSQMSFDDLRWTLETSNFPAASVGLPSTTTSSTFTRNCVLRILAVSTEHRL